MDKNRILDDIEKIQSDVYSIGFKGSNEHDLHLREDIADYIIKNFTIKDDEETK